MLLRNVRNEAPNNGSKQQTDALKSMVLQAIHEALMQERYEDMTHLVENAKQFGADYWEIRKALSRD